MSSLTLTKLIYTARDQTMGCDNYYGYFMMSAALLPLCFIPLFWFINVLMLFIIAISFCN